MQYFATASLCAVFFAASWPFWYCSEHRGRAARRKITPIMWVCVAIAVLCGAAAFSLGVQLFGIGEVSATISLFATTGGWFIGTLLVVTCYCSFCVYRASLGTDGSAAYVGRSAGRVVADDLDPKVEIKHKKTGKVLWRMAGNSLEGADLYRANLSGADLLGADLCGADLRGADLCRAALGSPWWRLGRAMFHIAMASGVMVPVLANLALRAHLVSPADTRSMVRVAIITGIINGLSLLATSRSAAHKGIRMRGANCQCANFSGAVLCSARLDGAIYDASTRWPRGFDPEQHGAMRVGGA
jgi:pentapeptide repeat protein